MQSGPPRVFSASLASGSPQSQWTTWQELCPCALVTIKATDLLTLNAGAVLTDAEQLRVGQRRRDTLQHLFWHLRERCTIGFQPEMKAFGCKLDS